MDEKEKMNSSNGTESKDFKAEKVCGAGHDNVKSTAVVKYQSLPLLSPFNQLQSNTNLNIPPSNWLRSNSKPEQYVRDIPWRREHSEFSSFNMANHFLDDITEDVDVVSDASNIKKLLKMPFSSSSHISMMVHRVGQTLLLDEFDIHQHLLRKEKEEWKWLWKFYEQIIGKNTEGKYKCVPKKSKSRVALQNRNMYSKFLYHSVQSEGKDDTTSVVQCHREEDEQVAVKDEDILTPLPDPLPQTNSRGFQREVLWTFENIKMLIGADLPIFGDETHPCVSLRLRESDEPINVLTGLDYWLDNLMCNVPEVAMCFHLDGFVQKYELLKTEDIPKYENSQFDPQLVLDIARNILSFLKSNATLEGHTYWLYKDSNDDVVKLYDLTTLCEGEVDHGNPFTVPVGILLYRVARNLRKNTGRKKTATIRKLLENCLLLLDEDKHSQVCTSAYYLLSDLYVPDSSIKDVWESNSDDSDEENTDSCRPVIEDDIKDNKEEVTVDIKTLYDFKPNFDRGWHVVRAHPIAGTVEERCQDAFKYIRKGLECLCRDHNTYKHQQKNVSIVEEQASCDNSEAIPLGYKPLASISTEVNLQLSTLLIPKKQKWQDVSKCLLLRKAAMTFYCAGKEYLSIQKYGHALRQIRFAIVCFEEMKRLIPKKGEENIDLLTLILETAGDIRLIMARNVKSLDEQERYFTDISEEEAAIVDTSIRASRIPEYDWVYAWSSELEQNLTSSVRCYRHALTLKPTDKILDTNLHKRLGNSLNELGVWYMNLAQNTLQSAGVEKVNLEKLKLMWEKSENCFNRGKEVFHAINDKANVTLLLSNTGKLMRLCAQTYTQLTISSDQPEFTTIEREYYTKAIDCYQMALAILKNGKQYCDIWESVLWELSTTYYNMAMLLQDYAPLSTYCKEEIEKDVIDLMNKSLKYCNMDCSPKCLPMCQYRSATINHRLASLHHHTLRDTISDQKKRYVKQLSDNHYSKAINLFCQLDCPVEMLRSLLEKAALLEFCQSAQSTCTNKGKIKNYCAVLMTLTDCEEIIDSLQTQAENTSNNHDKDSLIDILKSRLQYLLLHIIKTYTSLTKGKHETVIKEVKTIYARSLQISQDESQLLVLLKSVLHDSKNIIHTIYHDIG
ncbi:erythroid differentiation-related factor 1 [Patella vulgata]|uniref:erythroid differentiation-related factor 1 n=1 Tax=Patella vulgata TaxID=6465 RepID=UPI00218094C7|nr:erythroid differentiation-related factor 1 [Patella vulgata]